MELTQLIWSAQSSLIRTPLVQLRTLEPTRVMDRTREFTGLILAKAAGHDDEKPDSTPRKWQVASIRDEYTQDAYRTVSAPFFRWPRRL